MYIYLFITFISIYECMYVCVYVCWYIYVVLICVDVSS